MNTKFCIPAVLALFVVSASADLVIESKIESPQMNAAVTTKVKGGKVRADLTGPLGAMSSIIDSTTGATTQLIHSQKMVVKTTAEQVKAALEAGKKSTPDSGKPAEKPKATGQKEKVGDFDCEIYTWEGDDTSCKFWIALNHPQGALLKSWEKQMKSSVLGSAAGTPDLSDLAGPALKTETTTAGRKTVLTVLSVKETTVDASEFEVPKDYKSFDPSSFGGGAPAAK